MLRAALRAWLSQLAESEGSAESRMLNPFLERTSFGAAAAECCLGWVWWLAGCSQAVSGTPVWPPAQSQPGVGGENDSLPQGAASWEGEKRVLRKGPGLWVSVPRHDPCCCVPTAGAGE